MAHSRHRAPKKKSLTRDQIFQALADEERRHSTHKEPLLLASAYEDMKTSALWRHLDKGYGRWRLNLFDERFRDLLKHLQSQTAGSSAAAIHAMHPLTVMDEIHNMECIVSAHEMYERTIDRKGYYLRNAENQIIKQNIDAYKCIDGAVLIEACVGDGSKLKYYLKILKYEYGIIPKHIILIDINTYVLQEAFAEIGNEFGPVTLMPGDVSRKDFWMPGNGSPEERERKEIFRMLKKNDERTVLAMHATFNNLRNKQRLLEHVSQALKPETPYFIGIDCTTHHNTLAAAYACTESVQWLTAEYIYWQWEMGFDLNATEISYINASVDIKDSNDGKSVAVGLMINNHNPKPRKFTVSYHGHEQQMTLPAFVRCGENSKPTEEAVAGLFANAGWAVTRRLRRSIPEGDKTNVVIWHGRTADAECIREKFNLLFSRSKHKNKRPKLSVTASAKALVPNGS